MSELVPI